MLTYRNVNHAFEVLVRSFSRNSVREESRNGPVLRAHQPTLVRYDRPRERVLFNSARDCNPFFHLFEALWMLAARNDVATLDFYNSNMKNYSDDGWTFNGAYGYRWRNYVDDELRPLDVVDQLTILIQHLKENPNSRRAVLQMWNVQDDLLKVDDSKDVCCNLSVMFSLRNRTWLDMTVTNRSNDMIWGMLGANYVHFSFLQEYMACCLGVGVGRYYHFTNNLHVYEDNWEPEKWLDGVNLQQDYIYPLLGPLLVSDKETFDREVQEFVTSPAQDFTEPFLETVAKPMCLAFAAHKRRNYEEADEYLNQVQAADWKRVGRQWILKREGNWTRYEENTYTHDDQR